MSQSVNDSFIKISIITSVRNCLEETKEFLNSLRRFSKSLNYELILIDDGSEDETREFLKSVSNVRLLRNRDSRGFAYSNNLGASKAKGDWLIFMNNDLVLKKSWFVPFIEGLALLQKKVHKLGCLGNVQIDPRTSKIDHAGINFKEGFPSHYLLGEKKPNKEAFSEYLAVTGACFSIKKEVFLTCGGFDEDYKTGFEDIDLCLRLRMLGYRHFVANQSVILHKRSSTPQRNDHQEHNSRVFYGRWGKLITRFQEWERESKSSHLRVNTSNGKNYLRKNPENFLFADQKLLEDFFHRFLTNKKFQEAEDLLNVYEANHFGEKETLLLKSKLQRTKGDVQKAKSIIDLAIKNGFGQEPSVVMEVAQIHQACGNLAAARRKYFSLFDKPYQKQICILNIGDCYLAERKFQEAEETFTKAILLYPDSFRCWEKLAQARKELKKLAKEIQALKRAYSLSPQSKNIRDNLFDAYTRAGSNGRAYELLKTFNLRQATGGDLLKFGRVCIEIGDLSKAVWCLEKLIGHEEKLPEAYFLLGNALVLQKRFNDAVKAYSAAIEFRNDWPEAISNLINSKTFLCDWKERDEEIIKLTNFVSKNRVVSGAFELAGLYQSEKETFEQAKTRSLRLLDKVQPIAEKLRFTHRQSDSTKKRIGFLSSDFRNHAVGHLIIGLLDNLDRKNYEIFLYSTSISDGSEISKLIQQTTDVYHDLSKHSLVKKAQKINQDSLDLLIDLGGLSKGHNAELLALKPAPRQAHYLGYASTMGKGLVGWTIADKYVIPPSSTKNFSEKVIRMDGCFMPPGNFKIFAKRVNGSDVGLPTKGFVYCAFHAAYKIEPKIWACWMRILKAVPESVLWLKFKPAKDAYENLKAEAVRLGVSSKRIIMADDLADHDAHLSRMTAVDLYLDTPLYNGHASAMDALRAKLPILTVKGDRYCNRVGESFCRHLGMKEMIARNLKEYEKKAIEIGLRPTKLLLLRKKIDENAEEILSPSRHSQRFESAIDQILAKPISSGKESAKLESKLSAKHLSKSLEDFTLVMIRPKRITNWADNVSMLADELKKHGGQTIVIDQKDSKRKASGFSNSVQVLYSLNESFTDSINHSLCEISTSYLYFLDDPLRVLPASHFVKTIKEARASLVRSKIGILGICSSVEPHAGCLVTKTEDSSENGNQISGFFSPSFVLNADAVRKIGGLRKFGDTAALPMLDLSLRFSQLNYKTTYIGSEEIICPAHSADEYLSASSEFDKSRFVKLWKRHPVSLKPKFPPKDEQVGETADYQEWIRLCDTISEGDILAFKKEADELPLKPLISVIMPVFDPPKRFLIKAIESVRSQAYENWELCIADDASTKKYIRPLLESYARKDSRIKVTFRKSNGHISVASNSALKLSSGEFVAFLDHDDELRPHALLEVTKVANEKPDSKLIYSDEDKIDEYGNRYDPYFKPDWNPDLLLGQNYISHFSVFESKLVKKLRGLRKGCEGSQDWDLILRFTEKVPKKSIIHISKILYHWRAIKGSTALGVKQKENIFCATNKTMSDLKKRSKFKLNYKFIDNGSNWLRWNYNNYDKLSPKVSILIPTRDRIDLLEKCINSIRKTVKYRNYEIIIVNNESIEKKSINYFKKVKIIKQVTVLNLPGEFNYSRLNNLAVKKAHGEVILLLNNDIEAINQGWFEEMLSHALRSEIGCVGAKLLYPDGLLQHGGVIVGINGGAGHSHKFSQRNNLGYCGRLCIAGSTTAVTGACLMIRKKTYNDAGGMDENSLRIAFNDVDFCLRVEKLGYRNFWTPFTDILHHESATRGDDQATLQRKKRFSSEVLVLQNRWDLKSFSDRYYNPNLTYISETFRYGLKKLKEDSSKLSKYDGFREKKFYDSGKAYRKLFNDIADQKSEGESTFITVGGESKKIGEVSLDVLREFGLKCTDTLVDVGCGYGRLTEALSKNHRGIYLGTDVVPQLLNYAKSNFVVPGWRFELVQDFSIPSEDKSVDMVCFFSVFTHLLHEQSFTYLKDVHRSLKDGGRVVFSFLDFCDPTHIPCFESSVTEMDKGHPLNVFMNEELIRAWAQLLGFKVIEIIGFKEKKDFGFPFSDFGQSVACLEVR